ncbi:5'-3' exonuclease H3TH domain-containing protein [Bacillus mexicanus]|uniref:5'-3' exonuclease n=1 Tax=Bacillus mexicanus TaxID=2834415 RepID=UPI003D1C2E9E
MNRIFLIDGSSMLSTHFYGNLPASYRFAKSEEEKKKALKEDLLQTSTGDYTNGVFNMAKTILRLVNDYNPEYLAVCWDISRETFRRKLYPGYKSHRKDTPLQLSSQFPLMQKVLDYMGVPQFKKENYEADDLLGAISKRFSNENKIFILTKDRDALQLIDSNTTVWLNTKQVSKFFLQITELDSDRKHAPVNYFPFSLEAFRIIYGLDPIQLIDLKGLTGDKSDSIPGIDKMGEKTAIPILQHYKTIENFYDQLNQYDSKEFKKNPFR